MIGISIVLEPKPFLSHPEPKGKQQTYIQGFGRGIILLHQITKPFSQRLLLERVRAVLRRAEQTDNQASEGGITIGNLVMDPDRHSCTWKDEEVKLTVTEFLILSALARRPGVVKNRDQLLDAAYGETTYLDDRTIDSHIKRLRRKFREHDKEFDSIETLYGVGYKYIQA